MTGTDPIASGHEADIFAIDDRRVLRRYRNGVDAAREVTVMAHVAAHDFPVPTVYEAHGPEMVLERLDGPTMAQAMVTGVLGLDDGAAMLARLLGQLHAVPPRPGAGPGERVVHLDLHPENVMLTSRGPVVIDWCNGTDGPPELDLAISALILAQVSMDPANPLSTTAGTFLDMFLPLLDGDPLRLMDRAIVLRRAQLALTPDEFGALDTAADRVRTP